jgi:hypothetical protein
MPIGKQQYTNNAGVPLAGGRVHTYAIGTTEPKATYQDAAGTVENTNPIILDARGEALAFWDGAYSVKVTDAAGNLIYTIDNYQVPLMAADLAADSGAEKVSGTWYNGAKAKLSALGSTLGASLIGFTMDGVGAVKSSLQDRARQTVLLWDYLSDAQRADVAAGAGAIDCTAALQAAIDFGAGLRTAVNGYARGGVVVVLPQGAIKITQIVRKNGVSLVGAGRYKTLLLMSQNGGKGFRCAAADTQLAAGIVYYLDDADFSLIPNPATVFTVPTILWDMTGFTRCTWRNIALGFKGNVTAVSVVGAALAGGGGPAQWYNSFYDVFVEGEGGGVGWDLGDTNVNKEQITTWNWYGGRTASGSTGIGMRLNAATGCNLYAHCFEGLSDELIIGSAAGTRGCSRVNLFGCYFEGSVRGFTIYPNALSTGLFQYFATGVTNADNGTRTLRFSEAEISLPVTNVTDSFKLVQADAVKKPQVVGSAAPGWRLKNAGGQFVDIACGAATSSASSYFVVDSDLGQSLLKAGTVNTQIQAPTLALGNQSAVNITVSPGSPEGTFSAAPGSIYQRTDGGAGTSFYVKQTGTGNIGWAAK